MRLDPYSTYNFLVEIEGIIAGGFSQVSGLTVETGVEPHNEGGVNDLVYKLPKGTSYSDIELQKGITDIDILWYWHQEIVQGNIIRKNGTITLLDHSGNPVKWWDFYDAYPIKWQGPSLNASSGNTIAIETVTLTHHGFSQSIMDKRI